MIKTELNAWTRLNIIDCIWLHDSKISIQLRLKLHTHIERVGWHGMHPYWNSKMLALTLTAKQKCAKIITNHKTHCCFHLCPQEVRNVHLIPILHNLYLFIFVRLPHNVPHTMTVWTFSATICQIFFGLLSLKKSGPPPAGFRECNWSPVYLLFW